jgi:Dolichyl-phosphate-mannose-protein mannosyltransferase
MPSSASSKTTSTTTIKPKQLLSYGDDGEEVDPSSSGSSDEPLSKRTGYVSRFISRIPERWVPLLLFFFGIITRFYRLDLPAGVVFDESHFGRFTGQYHAGTYLFDIQ